MRQSVQLMRIWGIPIGFNSSWYLIFALVTWTLAVGYMPEAYPGFSTAVYWVLALATSALFFGSVIFHELAHAYVALRHHISVRRITLFIFGGVAEMEKEAESPRQEFLIAAAGPIASLLAAGFFFLLYQLDQQFDWLAAPTEYLIRINLLLAAFNLIPGFPLDGGRILRAVVWSYTDYRRATKTAAFSGQLFAYILMGVGIFLMIAGDFFNGLWLVFIGWFLNTSAIAQGTQATIKYALDQASVEQLMQPNWADVDGNLPISRLVDEFILPGGPRYYFVQRNGFDVAPSPHPAGMLTLTDISLLQRDRWPYTPARGVMVDWDELITIEPDLSLTQALQLMDQNNVNQLPVLRDGHLVGVLTRKNLLHYIRMETETA
ncbi:MAG: site-2 protease family protein [Candidatus Promineifilaceae bacterium]|nr:site-2 protease family protein [Candidatus Promineifilaceae bacterium]